MLSVCAATHPSRCGAATTKVCQSLHALMPLLKSLSDYQQVLQWGGVDELPARLLYENVLPATVKRLTDPHAPYWPGSPYGGKGWDTADPTIGDVHQWKVWGGAGIMEYYQNYDILGGRFVRCVAVAVAFGVDIVLN